MAKIKRQIVIGLVALAVSCSGSSVAAQQLSPAVLSNSPTCAELQAEITVAEQNVNRAKSRLTEIQTSINSVVELIADVLGPRAEDVSTIIQFSLVDNSSKQEVADQLSFSLSDSEKAIEEAADLYVEARDLKAKRAPISRELNKAQNHLKQLNQQLSSCQSAT